MEQYKTPDVDSTSPVGSATTQNSVVQDSAPDVRRLYASVELLERELRRAMARVRDLDGRVRELEVRANNRQY